jgi:hypothetical protein
MSKRSLLGLSALSLLLLACASTPPPVAQMAVAEAAVARASSVGTSEAAAGSLRVATGKLAAARVALAAGEHETALRLAEQATLDAQLADQQAQALRARKAAQESDDAARALRAELDRKQPR